MKPLRITAAVITSVAAATNATLLTMGPSPGTGAPDRDDKVWPGQRAESITEAQRIANAGAPNTLTLVGLPVRLRNVDVGKPGDSPGDFFLIDLRLYDESGETVVGRGASRCESAITTQTCHATLRLYERGQIVVDGVFYPNNTTVALSVLGGTGEFKGAGGVARSFETPDGAVLVLNFSR